METTLKLPDDATPGTIVEILAALRQQHLTPRHDAKTWGDWIYLEGYTTVIAIECNRGLSSNATVEHGEDESPGEPATSIFRAFGQLGWNGIDDEGEYSLA